MWITDAMFMCMQDTVFLDVGALHPGDFFGEVSCFFLQDFSKLKYNGQELLNKPINKKGVHDSPKCNIKMFFANVTLWYI